MTGYPEYNFPAFIQGENFLREVNPDAYIINPARMDILRGLTPENAGNQPGLIIRRDCMRRDMMAIIDNTPDFNVKETCMIVLMEGYLASQGAKIELELCRYLGWDSTTFVKLADR